MEISEEHEYTDLCLTKHNCEDCRYTYRKTNKQPCNICIITDTCYWQETGTSIASQEAYFLDIWRSCGEASTRECRNCPVPFTTCEKWNSECD